MQISSHLNVNIINLNRLAFIKKVFKGKNIRDINKRMGLMLKALNIIINIKNNIPLTTLVVFIFSGIYLLVIDRTDLSTKGLKSELTAGTILGLVYIFGSLAAFILFKYLI